MKITKKTNNLFQLRFWKSPNDSKCVRFGCRNTKGAERFLFFFVFQFHFNNHWKLHFGKSKFESLFLESIIFVWKKTLLRCDDSKNTEERQMNLNFVNFWSLKKWNQFYSSTETVNTEFDTENDQKIIDTKISILFVCSYSLTNWTVNYQWNYRKRMKCIFVSQKIKKHTKLLKTLKGFQKHSQTLKINNFGAMRQFQWNQMQKNQSKNEHFDFSENVKKFHRFWINCKFRWFCVFSTIFH